MSRFNMSVYEFDDVENVSYYDYMMYQADEIPSIPMEEMVAPLLVYSITYILGLVGNILILVAVTGQKQVDTFSKISETNCNKEESLG